MPLPWALASPAAYGAVPARYSAGPVSVSGPAGKCRTFLVMKTFIPFLSAHWYWMPSSKSLCDDPVSVCFMTIAELWYGAEKSREPERNFDTIEKFLLSVEIVQTDLSILKRFGTIKAALQKDGAPLADADVFIAAATLEKAGKLITGSARHFERIPGLVLEDWR